MKIRGLSRNVIVLGWVSFFTDMASEMLYPVIPIFVTSARGLGASPELLGLIEGVAEGGGSLLRWVVGAYSDRIRRRKPFVFGGYFISALSKPVMGLAQYALGWPLLFAGRATDRIGKSIRTSARDALIADSTDEAHRGLAFGFHRAMDTSGAVVGPLIAVAILWRWPAFPLAWLFFIAVGPGICSALLALAAVRETPHAVDPEAKPPSILQSYGASFWLLIVATAIFSLGNSSDTFLILRSRDLGLLFTWVILAYVLYNAIFALAATPLGNLSDRVGRKPVILAGWLLFAAVYLGFAATNSPRTPWLLFAIYGFYQAMTDGVTKAMISDVVDRRQRAGAIGMFYTVTGCCQFGASLITGRLWHVYLGRYHLQAGLLTGALGAAIAIPVLAMIRMRPRNQGSPQRHGGHGEQQKTINQELM